MYRILCIACLLGFSVAAAIMDFRHRRIPNALTLGAALTGLTINFAWKGAAGLLLGLKGLALGTAILLVPFALRWIGGGDLKTLAALGSFGGPILAWMTFLVGSSLAGVAAVVLLLFLRLRKRSSQEEALAPGTPAAVRAKPTLPYGALLALGGCLVLGIRFSNFIA